MLPNETQARAWIRGFLKSDLDEMRRIFSLALSLIPQNATFRVDRRRDVDAFVVLVILGLYSKALKTFRAIQLPCEAGLGQDALVLQRVLFETGLAINFILQRNSRLRARLFAVHPFVKTLQLLRGWRRTEGFKRKVTKLKLAAAEQPLRAAVRGLTAVKRWPQRHTYGPELPRALQALAQAMRAGAGQEAAECDAVEALFKATKKHWSGSGGVELASKTLRWGGAYETFYRYASAAAHALDYADHIEGAPTQGPLRLKLIPGADDRVLLMARTACLSLWSAAARINSRFGLQRDADFETTKPRLMAERLSKLRNTSHVK